VRVDPVGGDRHSLRGSSGGLAFKRRHSSLSTKPGRRSIGSRVATAALEKLRRGEGYARKAPGRTTDPSWAKRFGPPGSIPSTVTGLSSGPFGGFTSKRRQTSLSTNRGRHRLDLAWPQARTRSCAEAGRRAQSAWDVLLTLDQTLRPTTLDLVDDDGSSVRGQFAGATKRRHARLPGPRLAVHQCLRGYRRAHEASPKACRRKPTGTQGRRSTGSLQAKDAPRRGAAPWAGRRTHRTGRATNAGQTLRPTRLDLLDGDGVLSSRPVRGLHERRHAMALRTQARCSPVLARLQTRSRSFTESMPTQADGNPRSPIDGVSPGQRRPVSRSCALGRPSPAGRVDVPLTLDQTLRPARLDLLDDDGVFSSRPVPGAKKRRHARESRLAVHQCLRGYRRAHEAPPGACRRNSPGIQGRRSTGSREAKDARVEKLRCGAAVARSARGSTAEAGPNASAKVARWRRR
jgi:hypothetical protein